MREERVNVTTWKETSPKGWVTLSCSRRGVRKLLMEHQPPLHHRTVAPTGFNTSVGCALLLSPQNELSGSPGT